MNYTLPQLPYAYDALEPFIDARTMELHHAKHHATYVAKLNEAFLKAPEIAEKPLDELLQNLESVPESIRTAVQNHGGGHYNHSLFWHCMAPQSKGGGETPQGTLAQAITKTFGGYEQFKEQFMTSALGIFGSGWAWLVKDDTGNLKIVTTANQDVPFIHIQYPISNFQPLIACDVWEHAYYLKYQNRRADYIAAWWNIVNWHYAARGFSPSN